jgi:hypothetical protein
MGTGLWSSTVVSPIILKFSTIPLNGQIDSPTVLSPDDTSWCLLNGRLRKINRRSKYIAEEKSLWSTSECNAVYCNVT